MVFLIFIGIALIIFFVVGAVKSEASSGKVVDVSNNRSKSKSPVYTDSTIQQEHDKLDHEIKQCKLDLAEAIERERKYNKAANELVDPEKQIDITNRIFDLDLPVLSEADKTGSDITVSDDLPLEQSDILPSRLTFNVKGTFYRNKREISEAQSLEAGDTLILKIEPNNKFSNNAVQVLSINGYCIGYVEKSYSRLVSENLDRINRCRVVKVSSHEIPFIDGEICFSENECIPPSVMSEEFQISPVDKMNNLTYENSVHSNLWQMGIAVIGVYEQPRDAIAKARSLRQGDTLLLKKEESTDYYPYRVGVLTEDGTMLGFLYPTNIKAIYDNFDKIIRVMVDSPLGANDSSSLFIRIFFPCKVEIQNEDKEGIYYVGPYPQLQEANALKRSDPNSALDIALKVADVEKGIDAKFLCCQCYRILKDYESEEKMILRIIRTIDGLTPDDYDPHECILLKGRKRTEIEKRLAVVRSRINSKNRRNS